MRRGACAVVLSAVASETAVCPQATMNSHKVGTVVLTVLPVLATEIRTPVTMSFFAGVVVPPDGTAKSTTIPSVAPPVGAVIGQMPPRPLNAADVFDSVCAVGFV